LIPFGLLAAAVGCATPHNIQGTRVVDTPENRAVLEVCEKYRHALEDRDAETLISLASPQYFEDSGTPKADDDYGYDGLKQVILARLAALKAVRYNIEYRTIDVHADKAHVDIRFDASFQIATEMGDRWERKQNEKRLELVNNGKRWLFLSGM
jgi:hypothetical protein